MPYKHNQSSHRQHKKAKYKVINWAEYTEALRRRGDITIWFSVEAIDEWHPAKIPGLRGRPLKYSDVAIRVCGRCITYRYGKQKGLRAH